MAVCFYHATQMHRHYDYQHDDIINNVTRDNVCIEILKYYKYCNESVTTKSEFSNIY